MRELLDHPWVKVLLLATTVAMVSFALRETASLTVPVIQAVMDVLVPVAIGFTVAYIITPAVDGLCRLGLRRLFATGLLFAVAMLVLVVSLLVVVPALVRQSSDLVGRVFRGEPYIDANRNGHWDPGEPFTDRNANGQYDPALLSRGVQWAEERQDLLRLELDDSALRFLSLYLADTAEERRFLDGLLAAAIEGAGPTAWPPMPAAWTLTASGEWDQAWPGPTRLDIQAAAERIPAEHRPRWLQFAATAGERLSGTQARLLDGLAEQRQTGSAPNADHETVKRVRAALAQRPTDDARKEARAFAKELVRLDGQGSSAATAMLSALRGSSDASSAWMAKAVQQVEGGIRGNLDALPGRLGEWAQKGASSIDAVLAFSLSLLLVPIYAFFLTVAMPEVRRAIKDYIPHNHRDQTVRLVKDIERVVSAFFRGRLIISVLCAIVGVVGFLALELLGIHVPYAVLFGVAIGFATVIPLAGLLFLVPACVLALIEPNATYVNVVAVIGVYVLIQAAEAVLIPLIMGREVELHPVTLIIALLLCGKLLGVLGLILAVPIFASVRILAREFLWPRLRQWASRSMDVVQPPKEPEA